MAHLTASDVRDIRESIHCASELNEQKNMTSSSFLGINSGMITILIEMLEE